MEPQDRHIIRNFRTYRDVKEHVLVEEDEETSRAQELALLQPRLIDLKNFGDFFATQLRSTLDTSVFWGLLGLLLTVRDATRQILVRSFLTD